MALDLADEQRHEDPSHASHLRPHDDEVVLPAHVLAAAIERIGIVLETLEHRFAKLASVSCFAGLKEFRCSLPVLERCPKAFNGWWRFVEQSLLEFPLNLSWIAVTAGCENRGSRPMSSIIESS